MTVTVLDSAHLVEAVTTGVIPVPAGVAEDNAAQAAKAQKGQQPGADPAVVKTQEPAASAKDDQAEIDPDEVEGEDGLTPRQKREFTKSMLATIAKKHRQQKEAEELATSEYNRGRLAEERAERLERENAALKRQMAPPAAAAESAPPKREAFASDAAYQDALIDYRVDERLKAQALEEAKRRDAEAQAQLIQQAAARIDAARALVPDFDEVTQANEAPVPAHIGGYMQESEMFAELGYYFAKNPGELEKLTALTADLTPGTPAFVRGVTRSLVELGKIESKLQPFASLAKVDDPPNGTAPSRAGTPETGSAPSKPRNQAPIIRPLTAGSANQVGKDEKDMKPSEVINHWERKHGTRLTARKRH
jgi:hypothetical protein